MNMEEGMTPLHFYVTTATAYGMMRASHAQRLSTRPLRYDS